MYGKDFNGLFDELERFIWILVALNVVFVPLGIWKLCELISGV